jgi:hypothetical protein
MPIRHSIIVLSLERYGIGGKRQMDSCCSKINAALYYACAVMREAYRKKRKPLFEGSLKQVKSDHALNTKQRVFWDARYKRIYKRFPCGPAQFENLPTLYPHLGDKTLRSQFINCLRSYLVTKIFEPILFSLHQSVE